MSATLSAERRRRMLITALGEDIATAMRLPVTSSSRRGAARRERDDG